MRMHVAAVAQAPYQNGLCPKRRAPNGAVYPLGNTRTIGLERFDKFFFKGSIQ